ncbi:MAG TPA: IS5/IS1182 family transposase [Rhodospirillales bacterium]|nr:IS5/IS1182 family transposase [Rhodospirillales bacterium]
MEEIHKTFRPWDAAANATRLYSPASELPEDELVFFLLETVPQLNLSAFYSQYAETRGAPPFDVELMCTLLAYSYCVGVFSSRKIAAACERNLAFKAIVGSDPPDFRTISDFRKLHLDAFGDLFIEVLRLAGELRMVKLGNLALDGSKFNADASRHKAMSYGYMTKEVERLRGEIDELLKRAGQADAEEDAVLGSRRGDELPEELKRREDRLAAISEAMSRLEEQARRRADAQRARREADDAQREAEGKKRRGPTPAPVTETPEDKAQTNFTDPDAKIMKRANKGFDYCYNAQAVVDEEHQIIVGAEATADANDKQQAVPMVEATLETLQQAGIDRPTEGDAPDAAPQSIPISMDSGYFSEEAVGELELLPVDPHVATGRQKHNTPPSDDGTDEPAGDANAKERMAHKLRTPAGRACYAKRKQIVEPVFGQMKHVRGFRQFLLRGLNKVRAEWKLICLTHNLLKIWRHQCALS